MLIYNWGDTQRQTSRLYHTIVLKYLQGWSVVSENNVNASEGSTQIPGCSGINCSHSVPESHHGIGYWNIATRINTPGTLAFLKDYIKETTGWCHDTRWRWGHSGCLTLFLKNFICKQFSLVKNEKHAQKSGHIMIFTITDFSTITDSSVLKNKGTSIAYF